MELRIISSVFVFLAAFSVSARNLTFSGAVDLAQQNSLELQGAVLTEKSTRELETNAESGFFPKLSGQVNGLRSGAPGESAVDSYAAQLTLSQNLFAGLADLNRTRQAKANSRQAIATLVSTKAKLSSQLKQALAALQFAVDYKSLSVEIIKRRNDNLKNVELRFQGGRENKGSVLLSQAYLDEAKYDSLTAEHDAVVATEDLGRFLGLPIGEELVLTEPIPLKAPGAVAPDFLKLSTMTPDYLALVAQTESATAAVDINKSAFLPSLDISGSYGYMDEIFFPKRDRWSVGVTLSIPLFDGGRDYSNVRSAAYRSQSFAKQRDDLMQKTLVSLKQTYFDYVTSIDKEKLDDGFRQATVARAQIARSKYNNGLTTFDEWDRAESDLIARQRSYLESRRDRIVKEALWEQAQGVGVIQ